MLAIQRQGMILEKDRNKLVRDEKLATHQLLQSITRMDYQCLNKPIQWEDDSGEHTGFYHPMDLMHFLIKNLDIPSRGKLYQKLSICSWHNQCYSQTKASFTWICHYVKLK